MKLFNSIAAAAVIGASFIMANPVQAGSCYPASASMTIKQVVNGGGSWDLAWQAARQEGQWDGSEVCTYRVKSYLN